MSAEQNEILAREIVALFRATFTNVDQRQMTFKQVRDGLRSCIAPLELKWAITNSSSIRGYANALPRAEEIANIEITVRRAEELETQSEAAPPMVFKSKDSVDWLDGSENWPERGYWSRYKKWMFAERPTHVVQNLERDARVILGRLGNPQDSASWDRRGLVVGQVQSGKTQNFVGLLAMAIDAGYRQIVVLSGIHEDLRAQTQYRVDEGLIGQTYFDEEHARYQHRFVGVMKDDQGNTAEPGYTVMTSCSKKEGDFSEVMSSKVTGSATGPYIYVVKKTKARLNRLKNHFANQPVLLQQPLIVVDDEADQASINVGKEDDPTTINRLIRELLDQFERRSYVGYTATPFANIFGDPDHQTESAGSDLFPKDFIVRLNPAPGYFGPEEFFGSEPSVYGDELGTNPSDVLVVPVRDAIEWKPPSKKSTPWTSCEPLPESLLDGIADFLVGAAIKSFRVASNPGINPHTTMLVNVPRMNTHQKSLQEAITNQKEKIHRDVAGDNQRHDSWINRLKAAYETRLSPTLRPTYGTPPSWPEILMKISELVSRKLTVEVVNGTVEDMIEYDKHKEDGRLVIAIGGDKLSRGMTLEGLTVSYFLRRSNAWDTLLQMGRWFGYKSGYLDLCRLRTSDEIINRFREVSRRIENMNADLDELYGQGAEPSRIGMFVSRSELNLLPTGRQKFKLAKLIPLQGRHSGKAVFRPFLPAVLKTKKSTLDAARWLSEQASQLSSATPDGLVVGSDSVKTFFGVPAAIVAEYIQRAGLPSVEGRQSNAQLSENILSLAGRGFVRDWVVGFPTSGNTHGESKIPLTDGVSVTPALRTAEKEYGDGFSTYGSGDISQSLHVWADITYSEIVQKDQKPSSIKFSERGKEGGPFAATFYRPASRGLLLCYVIVGERGGEPGAIWHLSFPKMTDEQPYEVWANPVYAREALEQLEGM